MALERSSIFNKLKSVGGLKTIFGRTGTDFYFSLIVTLIYLGLFIIFPKMSLIWENSAVIAILLVLLTIQFTAMLIISNWRNDVHSKEDFSLYLEENNFLASVDFYFDFTSIVLFLSFLSWIILAIGYLTFFTFSIYNVPIFGIENSTFFSFLFSVPLFFFVYFLGNLYHCWKARIFFKDLEIKFLNKNKKKAT